MAALHGELRCRPSSPNMRKTFKTGWSIPLLASTRKPGEVRLVFELERPGQRAFQVDAMPAASSCLRAKHGRRVAGVHGAVAIAVLRALAGGAPFRVGLADHDRRVFELGKRGDDGKGAVDVVKLVGDPHTHMTVVKLRAALGMERDEVQGRARLRLSRS